MKKFKLMIGLSMALILPVLALSSVSAQDLVKASLRTTCVSTNQAGDLVYTHSGNNELISACAAQEGLTNMADLSLMYNMAAGALQVVTSTNNAEVGTNHVIVDTNQFLICTPLTFMNLMSLTGTNTNKVEILASVFVETNTVASGTLVATERFNTNSTNSFSLVGKIQYGVAANGTNSAQICKGVLLVGVSEQENEGHGHGHGHGNQGNHGNHGQGNNGNHGQGNNGNHGNGNNGNHGNSNNGHHG